MNGAAVQLLAAEAIGLPVVVLALFWVRRYVGLTPLYVSLGMFQPVQVMLSASVYVEMVPGMVVSPGTLMFATSLLAILLVYIREDASEVRKIVYGVLGANLTMTLIMLGAALQLRTPGTENLLALPAEIFHQGARVTVVGTLVLVADVAMLILFYTAAVRLFPRSAVMRVSVTLGGALLFDAVAFTTGAFFGRSDFTALLASAALVKLAIAVVYSGCLVAYLKFIEPQELSGAAHDHHLRDMFYSLTYRDKFELQAQKAERLDAERRQVFERITDAFVALDGDWRYTYVNAKAAQIFGLRPQQLLGTFLWEHIPQADREPFESAYRKAMTEQKPAFLEAYYAPFGRWFENRIYPSPEGLTVYFHDVTERVTMQRDMLQRANRDELTGLPNRRAVREALDTLIDEGLGDDSRFVGVIALNIDRLHHVNDTLGYAAGDRVLVEAAQRLDHVARESGCTVGRIGGDEFLLVTSPVDSSEGFEPLARAAAQVLAQPYAVDVQSVYLTCSAGVSWYPEAGQHAAQLLGQSDLAVNLAKQRGRNQIVVYSHQRAADAAERITMTTDMREALQRDEFSLQFQPLVDAQRGSIVAAEALLRWNSPRLGPVPPSRFIPIAEDAGMIVELGRWALRAALAQLAHWKAGGLAVLPLSVNVSVVQLQRDRFPDEVEQALRASGIDAALLKLEITESLFMEDPDHAVATLERLKQLGVRVSLDDFGTGYSSLGHLRQLPLDEIKIDMSFVRGIPEDSYAATLCEAIIAMSRQLHFTVVAEGVETPAQARFLRAAGCPLLQGYLFSRPVSGAALGELIGAQARWGEDGVRQPA